MQTFDYTSAASVDEAVKLLGQTADGAIRPLAGGTDLLTLLKEEIATPAQLVDIKRAHGLSREIRETADELVLGALATLADLETHPLVQADYPALASAAALAATPQLRNMATLGGNLLQRPRCWYFRNARVNCWLKGGPDCPARDGENRLHALFGGGPCYAVHPSDLATVLLAFDASVDLQGGQGARTVRLSEFFTLPSEHHRSETAVHSDEILLAVRVPKSAAGMAMRSVYLKAMDRKVWAFALVGVAAALRLDGGRVADARLVLSGVAPIPWRSHAAEQILVGEQLKPVLFDRAAKAALADAQPLHHNAYKVPLAQALIRRALEQVVE